MINRSDRNIVRRTKLASPSKIWLVEKCILRYLYETENTKRVTSVDTPSTIIGNAVHSTIEKLFLRQKQVGIDYVDTLYAEISKGIEKALNSTSILSYVVRTYGVNQAINYGSVLRQAKFLKSTVEKFELPQTKAQSRATKDYLEDGNNSIGVEQWFEDEERGLAGRVDLYRVNDKDQVEIIDFKSGKILAEDGSVKEEYEAQMAAYGYLIEKRFPGKIIILRLCGVDSDWKLVYGPEIASRVLHSLEKLRVVAPPGTDISAEKLASRGEHCGGCINRSTCPAYLFDLKERGVIANGRDDANFFYDISGEIISITERDSEIRGVKIGIANDGVVLVQGIPKTLINFEKLKAGGSIFIFAAKSLELAGTKERPSNYTLLDRNMPSRSSFLASIGTLEA